mmetsp:Transcript_35160/g.59232  ORF Transcript_35160/g.59232 Transcript_35160/m.59232 type:complete len:521 (-) Transcript_35160:126-1688(-)
MDSDVQMASVEPTPVVRQRSKYLEEYSKQKQTGTSRSCNSIDLRNSAQQVQVLPVPTSPARPATPSSMGSMDSGSGPDETLSGFMQDDEEQVDDFSFGFGVFGGWDDSEVGIISVAFEEQLLQPLPALKRRPQSAHVGGLRPDRLRNARDFRGFKPRRELQRPSWAMASKLGDGSEESGSHVGSHVGSHMGSHDSVCHVRPRVRHSVKCSENTLSGTDFEQSLSELKQVGLYSKYPADFSKPPIPKAGRLLKSLSSAHAGHGVDGTSGVTLSGMPRLGRRAVRAQSLRSSIGEEEEESEHLVGSCFSSEKGSWHHPSSPYEPTLLRSGADISDNSVGGSRQFGLRRVNSMHTHSSLHSDYSSEGIADSCSNRSLDALAKRTSRRSNSNSLDSSPRPLGLRCAGSRNGNDRAPCGPALIATLGHTDALEKRFGDLDLSTKSATLDFPTKDNTVASVHRRQGPNLGPGRPRSRRESAREEVLPPPLEEPHDDVLTQFTAASAAKSNSLAKFPQKSIENLRNS